MTTRIVGTVCLMWLLASARPAASEQEQTAPDKTAELKALLQERHVTLQEVVKVLTAQYRAGLVHFEVLTRAQRDLLRASLELQDKPEDRIMTLRSLLALAQETAKISEMRFKSGRGSESDHLQAKALVLDAKIELLREELKAQPRK